MTDITTLLKQVDLLKVKLDQYRDWQRSELIEALHIEYTYDSNCIKVIP